MTAFFELAEYFKLMHFYANFHWEQQGPLKNETNKPSIITFSLVIFLTYLIEGECIDIKS